MIIGFLLLFIGLYRDVVNSNGERMSSPNLTQLNWEILPPLGQDSIGTWIASGEHPHILEFLHEIYGIIVIIIHEWLLYLLIIAF